mmetsp:Transcript_12578/g.20757  ORF Transcript_12578/g.20757 Transcript_12578/m.20757 type:complete len:814 (-) Transcript_12578:160-2601(-)
MKWQDVVPVQAGAGQGRGPPPSSNVVPPGKAEYLSRSPSWPRHPARAASPAPRSEPPAPPPATVGEQGSGIATDANSVMAAKLAVPTSPLPEQEGLSTAAMRPGLPVRGEAAPQVSADTRSDVSGGVAPRPGRQAVDAILRRPESEVSHSGKAVVPGKAGAGDRDRTPSEVSLPRSGAGEGARTRLATVVEASPPPTAEHVAGAVASTNHTAGPELLDTERSPGPSTYSDARDSQSRSPMRRSRDGHGEGSGDTRSTASRRRDRLRLPDFMVQMPAGSGCSELHGSSTFVDVETSSYTMEAQGVVRPTDEAQMRRKCLDYEAKIKALRAEHAEEMVRERNDRQQQVQALEEKLRRTVAQAAEDEARLRKEIESLQARTSALTAAEASIAQLRQELEAEVAVAESASRYQFEASQSKAALGIAEKQREEVKRKFEAAKRQAGEAERQRRDLAKQSGTQEAQRLRVELETVSNERADLVKKLKKVVPHVHRLQTEESKLQQLLAEQTELAASQGRTAKMESQEASKLKDNVLRQKRSFQGQVSTLNSELEEAKAKVKEEQKQRYDENRKQQNAKAEIKRLRSELNLTETALQQQAQNAAAAQAAYAANHNSVNHHSESWAAAQVLRSVSPNGRSLAQSGPAPGVFVPVLSATAPGAVRSRSSNVVLGAGSAAPSKGKVPTTSQVESMEEVVIVAQDSATQVEQGIDIKTDVEVVQDLSHNLDKSPSPSQEVGAVASSYIAGGLTAGSGEQLLTNGSVIINHAPLGVANSASARLFEVIEKAKERADQRRLLSGAAEEVKVKAQALEELLARDDYG